jgi:hypothetical protein
MRFETTRLETMRLERHDGWNEYERKSDKATLVLDERRY